MKLFILISLTHFFYCQINFSINTTISEDSLHDVEFINDNIGWAYTYGTGKIYKTITAGKQWKIISQLDKEYFEQIEFIDSTNGVIVGGNKRVYITKNGGKTWKDISPKHWKEYSNVLIYGLYYDKSIIYISTMVFNEKKRQNINYYSKTDGQHWESIDNKDLGMFLSIIKNKDFFAGGNGLFTSNNEGKSWSLLAQPARGKRFAIRGIDFENKFSVASDFVSGTIIITHDAWKNYNTIKITKNRIRDIRIIGTTIIAIGDANKSNGVFHYSNNAGKTWSTLNTIVEDLHRMDETKNFIYIVGKKGRFLKLNKNKLRF